MLLPDDVAAPSLHIRPGLGTPSGVASRSEPETVCLCAGAAAELKGVTGAWAAVRLLVQSGAGAPDLVQHHARQATFAACSSRRTGRIVSCQPGHAAARRLPESMRHSKGVIHISCARAFHLGHSMIGQSAMSALLQVDPGGGCGGCPGDAPGHAAAPEARLRAAPAAEPGGTTSWAVWLGSVPAPRSRSFQCCLDGKPDLCYVTVPGPW